MSVPDWLQDTKNDSEDLWALYIMAMEALGKLPRSNNHPVEYEDMKIIKKTRHHPHALVYCNRADHSLHFITEGLTTEDQYCTACGDKKKFYPNRQNRCSSNCSSCDTCEVCKKNPHLNMSSEDLAKAIPLSSKKLEDLPPNLF